MIVVGRDGERQLFAAVVRVLQQITELRADAKRGALRRRAQRAARRLEGELAIVARRIDAVEVLVGGVCRNDEAILRAEGLFDLETVDCQRALRQIIEIEEG